MRKFHCVCIKTSTKQQKEEENMPPPTTIRHRTMNEIAELSARETQPLRREVRRLFRHRLVRELFGVGELQNLGWSINCLLDWIPRHPNLPVSMRKSLESMIRSTQRSVDEDDVCPPDFNEKCTALVKSILCLQTGYFTGVHICPIFNAECCICLHSSGGGHWWYSNACGHCYHVNCIANHLRHDTRCPLCRIDFTEL